MEEWVFSRDGLIFPEGKTHPISGFCLLRLMDDGGSNSGGYLPLDRTANGVSHTFKIDQSFFLQAVIPSRVQRESTSLTI